MVAHDRLADASRAGRPIPSAKQKGGLREGFKSGRRTDGPGTGVPGTGWRRDRVEERRADGPGTGVPRDRLVAELLMGEWSDWADSSSAAILVRVAQAWTA